MKTVSFVVPCYNSAEYMDTGIEILVTSGEDVEVIIVNDGSNDSTSEKAHAWETTYPHIVRAIDQENRGHGGAVNHGLQEATGIYFKVVDSDDWLDKHSLEKVLAYLRQQRNASNPCDLVIANYVYDKMHLGTKQSISYRNVFPVEQQFTWDDVGRFRPSQYLLMHSVIYRTELLHNIHLSLPEHCFYVDNIFVYVPLPHVKTMYYFDSDLYHYFIGRDDQSVHESVMLSRIDQQLHITRTMIDSVDLTQISNPHIAQYMYNYLSMMMCICSIFLRMEENSITEEKRRDIWEYLHTKRPGMYAKIRAHILNLSTNLPSPIGRALGLGGYHLAQKIFKFN